MKQYLSIGEVAKIKNVGIKALRYYDKIGVFKPAYIDPETDYRYYTIKQTIMLDLILICVDLGIPLTNFERFYGDENQLDITKVICEGKVNIAKQKERLSQNDFIIRQIEKMLLETKEISNMSGVFFRKEDNRHYLTSVLPIAANDFVYDKHEQLFVSETVKLFSIAKELQALTTPNYGIMYCATKNSLQLKSYLEIDRKVTHPNCLSIKRGDYKSYIAHYDDLEQSVINNILLPKHSERVLFIIEELIDEKFPLGRRLFEIQEIK